jgi:hypothetical protein
MLLDLPQDADWNTRLHALDETNVRILIVPRGGVVSLLVVCEVPTSVGALVDLAVGIRAVQLYTDAEGIREVTRFEDPFGTSDQERAVRPWGRPAGDLPSTAEEPLQSLTV